MIPKTETKSVIIECDCGNHMLKVESDVEYFDDAQTGKIHFRQDIMLAMFSYGADADKEGFFTRLKIAWKYLKGGKMFSDQLCLKPDEAKKLELFLTENIIEVEK